MTDAQLSHPATTALLSLASVEPMTGDELRSIRKRIGLLIGMKVPQYAFAALLRSTQPTYCEWERADLVPARTAVAARLALDAARTKATPEALRPTPEVVAALFDLSEQVEGAFADSDAADFRALTFFAVGCRPDVIAWRRSYAETVGDSTAVPLS